MTTEEVLVQVDVKLYYSCVFFEIRGLYVKLEAALVEDGHDGPRGCVDEL